MASSHSSLNWSIVAKHEAFPRRAAAGRGVADVADDDAGLLVDVLEQGRADGDVARTADDGVVGIDAERREEGVHRAAHAPVEAGVAGEDLRQRAVDEDSRWPGPAWCPWRPSRRRADSRRRSSSRMIFISAASSSLWMADRPLARISPWLAMRAVDVVVDVQQIGLADGGGFLADRKVRRAAVVVFDVLEVPLLLDRIEHVLRTPG